MAAWDVPSMEPRPLSPPSSQGAILGEPCADVPINDRQREIVNRLLDGFEGNLTTVKWAKLTKTSHDTALRDIQDLIDTAC